MNEYKHIPFKELKQFDKVLFRGTANYNGFIYLTHQLEDKGKTEMSPGISYIIPYTTIKFYDMQEDCIWSGMYSTSDIFVVATQ